MKLLKYLFKIVLIIGLMFLIFSIIPKGKADIIGFALIGVSVVVGIIALWWFLKKTLHRSRALHLKRFLLKNRIQKVLGGGKVIGLILIVLAVIGIVFLYNHFSAKVDETKWVTTWEKAPGVIGVNPEQRKAGPFDVKFTERNNDKMVFTVLSGRRKLAEVFLKRSENPKWDWVGIYNDPICKEYPRGEIRFKEYADGSLEGEQSTLNSQWVDTRVIRRL